jgi:ABC-2 type transport system permease protein
VRTWFRIFFIGGAISFRALFAWIRPWVYIPTLVVGPTSQILFFAFLGRTAHLEDDAWFVVGNAVQSASLAALFGMGFAIDGERWT